MTRGQVGDLYWHVHHGQLAEVLTQPIENRVRYINSRKPLHERATRLRWMEPVATAAYDRAWADFRRARDVWDRAWADDTAWVDLDQAWGDYERAWDDFRRARVDYDRAQAALEPLHALEHPGCPWDGRTLVFPEVTP